MSVYDTYPFIENEDYIFRLVKDEDASELLPCYSNKKSVSRMNSDNCSNNFYFENIDIMKIQIKYWLIDFHNKVYIRYIIFSKRDNRIIGDIELFEKETKCGLLRLDLLDSYENYEEINKITEFIIQNLMKPFMISSIMTKIINSSEREKAFMVLEDLVSIIILMIIIYIKWRKNNV